MQKPKNLKTISSHSARLMFFVLLLFALTSCAYNPSNVGKIVPDNQALPATAATEEDQTWKTKDVEVVYRITTNENGFAMEGELSVNDSVTRSFPSIVWLNFYINYLDNDNRVISTEKIAINTGYKNKKAKNLKLINVPPAPAGMQAFSFSYWGVLTGRGISDENPGEWEIYHQPFGNPVKEVKSQGNGIFYKQ